MSSLDFSGFVYEPTPPPSPTSSPFRNPLSCSQEAILPPNVVVTLRKSQEMEKTRLRKSNEALTIETSQPDPIKERFRQIGLKASHKPIPKKDWPQICPESSNPQAELRNRYPSEILPTSLGLVKLKAVDTYINANHFKGKIITQGPFINVETQVDTVADFFLMLFENCSDAVCLTNHMGIQASRYVEKTYPYWKRPQEDDEGPIYQKELTLKNGEKALLKVFLVGEPITVISREGISEKVTKRTLAIHLNDDVKQVMHWFFENWDDHGTCDPEILAQFIVLLLSQKGTHAYHCSAGIGRTGVLAVAMACVEEYILKTGKMPSDEEIDEMVVALRQSRPMSVQKPEQLKLISDVLKAFIKLYPLNRAGSEESKI